MDDDKKAEGRKTVKPGRQHQRQNRGSRSSRSSHVNSEENTPQQEDSDDASTNDIFWQNRFSGEAYAAPENSADSDTVDYSLQPDYLNQSGLNGVRQLLNDVDAQLSSVEDGSLNPSDIPNSVSVSNSLRNRTTSPTSHRGERRRARRRIPAPSQFRAETFVRNTSPSRQNRQYHNTSQHIPPLRFSSSVLSESPPPTSPTVEYPSSGRFVDGPFGATRQLGPFPNPYFRGYGTEDEPYELSPAGLSDESSSPPAFDGPGNLQSDEEIARQLQQEEWEAAGNYSSGRHHSRQPRGGGFNSFHFPHRRGRASELSPLRLSRSWAGSRGGQSSSRENSGHHLHQGSSGSQAAGNLPVFRPQGFRRRSQDEPLPMRSRLEHWAIPVEEFEGSYGNLALLTDLLGSYGLSDWADIEAILNPGAVGQRPFINPDFMDYESLLALGEQLGEVSKGMEDSEIDKLAICRHKTSPNRQEASAAAALEPPQCNICLTDYDNGDEKRVLPCKHEFHKHCVDQWLKTNATCPVCRSDVRKKES